MNTKPRAVALICAFGLLAACSKSDGDRITDVLNQCAQNSKNAAVFNSSPGAQANYIAAEAQKVGVRKCPPDFRMAYQAHVNAWLQAVPYLANNNFGTAFMEGLTAGITADSRFIGQADQKAEYAIHQINQTYSNLTQIAAKYGARIPRSVVGQ